jgi:hypothetical protein
MLECSLYTKDGAYGHRRVATAQKHLCSCSSSQLTGAPYVHLAEDWNRLMYLVVLGPERKAEMSALHSEPSQADARPSIDGQKQPRSRAGIELDESVNLP